MKLDARVTVYVPRSPQEVFDFAVANENMPGLLRVFGPIPGVIKVELLDGSILSKGARRLVSMSDGTTMREEVLELTPPTSSTPGRHEYRWMHAPAPPFSLLVKSGHADWTFSAERDGTRVNWDYQFELTSPLAYPLAAPAIALFRGWMQRAIDRLRATYGAAVPPR